MCGRATLARSGDEIGRLFGLSEIPALEPRYNIAPSQPIAVVRREVLVGNTKPGESGRRLDHLVWGLIPSWSTDATGGAKRINARLETVATKPAFAEPFRARRCLVVVDGFYEWQRQGRSKQAHHIRREDAAPFALAGLWDRWTSKSTPHAIESCTILTRDAVGSVRELHDRMPVMIGAEDYDAWLDPLSTRAELEAILRKPAATFVVTPVSAFVNSPEHEGPACLLPHGGTNLSLF